MANIYEKIEATFLELEEVIEKVFSFCFTIPGVLVLFSSTCQCFFLLFLAF